MKCRKWMYMTMMLFVLLTISAIAQDNQNPGPKHHHYQINDSGTFGGPQSYNESDPPESIINDRGAAVGYADTSVPDPFAPNCFGYQLTCVVTVAYVSLGGVLTDLGALIPGYSSGASAINARGEAVGVSENGQIDPLTAYPEGIAVLWKNGIVNLGTLGGNQSLANAITDRGQVVGAALNTISDPFANTFSQIFLFVPAATQAHAFRWTEAGGMQDLGTLGGPDSSASFVNRRGQIAGESFTSFTPNPSTGVPTLDPFFWEDGKMVDIGTLGGTAAAPKWMNNRGPVVGGSNIAGDQLIHAFLWDQHNNPPLTDLGTLGGSYSNANSINDEGAIVGGANLAGDQSAGAFLWKDGTMTNLGTVAGDTCSGANWINSRGQIVATSGDCNFDDHAGLSENGGPLVALQSLVQPGSGVTLVSAIFINDRGEIAARGNPPNGYQHAVLLIPCDDNHPGVEGCDYSMVDAATAAAQSAESPYVPSAPQPLPQGRRSDRYHMPGRQAPGR